MCEQPKLHSEAWATFVDVSLKYISPEMCLTNNVTNFLCEHYRLVY